MHHGCVADANDGEEGRGGVVADIAKLSVGREAYYTRELATDHEQYLSGHGESPGRWYGAGATTVGLQGEAFVNERLTWNLNHRDSDDPGWAVDCRAQLGRARGGQRHPEALRGRGSRTRRI
jgi:hypothetical protein